MEAVAYPVQVKLNDGRTLSYVSNAPLYEGDDVKVESGVYAGTLGRVVALGTNFDGGLKRVTKVDDPLVFNTDNYLIEIGDVIDSDGDLHLTRHGSGDIETALVYVNVEKLKRAIEFLER